MKWFSQTWGIIVLYKPKLISRKIREAEKFLNFHTVQWAHSENYWPFSEISFQPFSKRKCQCHDFHFYYIFFLFFLFQITCDCGEKIVLDSISRGSGKDMALAIFECPQPSCQKRPLLEKTALIKNQLMKAIRGHIQKYYSGWIGKWNFLQWISNYEFIVWTKYFSS